MTDDLRDSFGSKSQQRTEGLSVPAYVNLRDGTWIRTDDATEAQVRDHIRLLKARAVLEAFDHYSEHYGNGMSSADYRKSADDLERYLDEGRPKLGDRGRFRDGHRRRYP
jgi:hypothetical protein